MQFRIFPPPGSGPSRPSWHETNEYVATVDQSGRISAASSGTAFVVVDYCGEADLRPVRVTPAARVTRITSAGGTVSAPSGRATFTVLAQDIDLPEVDVTVGDGFSPPVRRGVPASGVALTWPPLILGATADDGTAGTDAEAVPDQGSPIRRGTLVIRYAGLVTPSPGSTVRMIEEVSPGTWLAVGGGIVDPASQTVRAVIPRSGTYALELVEPYVVLGELADSAESADRRAQIVAPSRSYTAVGVPIPVVPATGGPSSPNLVPSTTYSFGSAPFFESERPMTIRIRYDPAAIPGGAAATTLRLVALRSGAWRPVVESAVDEAMHVVTGRVGGLGVYALMANASTLPAFSTLRLSPATLDLATGSLSGDLHLTGVRTIGAQVHDPPAAWRAGDTTIAIVTPEGRVMPRMPGSTTIRATAGGASASATVRVALRSATGVSAGTAHTCAMTVAASARYDVFCWGNNMMSQQVGDGSTINRLAPVAVDGPVLADRLAAGHRHTCTIQVGPTWCWGNNAWGQTGSGTYGGPAGLPVMVASSAEFTSVTAGDWHSCATTRVGTYCWGRNDEGQLGTGMRRRLCDGLPCETEPMPVAQGRAFRLVEAGANHTCGLLDRSAWCWGSDGKSQLGMPNTTIDNCGSTAQPIRCSLIPRQVQGGIAFRSLDAGGDHTCGIEAGTDHVLCWGRNDYGQLGIPDGSFGETPTPIASSARFESVSAGRDHTCAIEAITHALWCWGRNDRGQLGLGTTAPRVPQPSRVSSTLEFAMVSAGDLHTCALAPRSMPGTAASRLWCWGANPDGRLGVGTTTDVHVPTRLVGQSVP